MRDVLARLLNFNSHRKVIAHDSTFPGDKRQHGQVGSAIIEVALLMPWIVFLFVGILNAGFFSYAMIVTENAARVSAMQASISRAASTDSLSACVVALQEMSSLPNAVGLTTCESGSVSASSPVSVVASSVDHGSGDVSARVTVMYLTLPLIPIPGILPGQMTVTRSAEVRIGS
jgi:hypothetical protein